jgi:hypothetical protein
MGYKFAGRATLSGPFLFPLGGGYFSRPRATRITPVGLIEGS